MEGQQRVYLQYQHPETPIAADPDLSDSFLLFMYA